MYASILVPLDGSGLSELALPHALALAERLGARLKLMRVVSPLIEARDLSNDAAAESYENILDKIRRELLIAEHREAEGYVAAHRDRLEDLGFKVEGGVAIGDPADIVVEAARTTPLTLIVMATHGRSGVGRLALGSVADRVLRTATVPVFLVRPPAPTRGT